MNKKLLSLSALRALGVAAIDNYSFCLSGDSKTIDLR